MPLFVAPLAAFHLPAPVRLHDPDEVGVCETTVRYNGAGIRLKTMLELSWTVPYLPTHGRAS